MIPGIPTIYRGVQFRSRLEAKWAAFFDGCHIAWEYEPFDLRGYIPDFTINDGTSIVEVKPESTIEGLLTHVAKIDASGWTGGLAIVGVHPLLVAVVRGVGPKLPPADEADALFKWVSNEVKWERAQEAPEVAASATCSACGEAADIVGLSSMRRAGQERWCSPCAGRLDDHGGPS